MTDYEPGKIRLLGFISEELASGCTETVYAEVLFHMKILGFTVAPSCAPYFTIQSLFIANYLEFANCGGIPAEFFNDDRSALCYFPDRELQVGHRVTMNVRNEYEHPHRFRATMVCEEIRSHPLLEGSKWE